MSKTYLRGDLYYADLGHGIGSEQKGTRPVVIIQNNVGNKHSPTVIIAAVTSKANVKAKLPTHYYLDAGNGLVQPSLVLLEQIRTVDKRRLSGYIGRLDEEHIRGINHALAISIGLIEPAPPKLTLCLCAVSYTHLPTVMRIRSNVFTLSLPGTRSYTGRAMYCIS